MRRLAILLPTLIVGLVLGALLVVGLKLSSWLKGPDPETVASASLQSMREQARLVPFAARFVSVVTSTQTRFGLQAQRTIIMPGTVRYELDLAALQPSDMVWDEGSKTLAISLPPLEISAPEIDLGEVREYGGGGLLTALTDAEKTLDSVNRKQGQAELVRQARQPMPMRLAMDSAKRAVERSFAMPLKAAGVDAKVAVRFRSEGSRDPSQQLDRSTRIEDAVKERQAGQ